MVKSIIGLINNIIDNGKQFLRIDFINQLQNVKMDFVLCGSWIDGENVKEFYFNSLKAHIKDKFNEKEKRVLDVLTNHVKELERKAGGNNEKILFSN